MQISGVTGTLFGWGGVRIGSTPLAASTSSATSRAPDVSADDFDAIHRLQDLRLKLMEAKEAAEAPGLRSNARRARLRVGLDDVGSASSYGITTLRSSEQVNTETSSLEVRTGNITGGGTAKGVVTGVYTGTTDLDIGLWFENNATVGTDEFSVLMWDESSGERITVPAGTPPDTPITFSNGITFTIGAGKVVKSSRILLYAKASVPAAFDPTKAFSGVNKFTAHFEDGVSISNGSFEINGTSIAVSTSDTLNTVLARINSSAAGVTASWDAASEQVLIERKVAGNDPITLENDTSGLLAALKLDDANVDLGSTASGIGAWLEDIPRFAGLSSGSFEIDGTSIAVDPATDTLDDLLGRIEAAGVSASWNEGSGVLTIESERRGESFTIGADSSGFLSAAGIAPGSYSSGRGGSRAARQRLTESLQAVSDSLSQLYARADEDGASLRQSRALVSGLLTRRLGSTGIADTGAGLRISLDALSNGNGEVSRFGNNGQSRLALALARSPSTVVQALVGGRGADRGLLVGLLQAVNQAREGILQRLPAGSMLDLQA